VANVALHLTSDLIFRLRHYQNSSEIGKLWDRVIETFVSPSDTLAQWIMAVFSVIVVILVWKTFFATQDMARDTREIGGAQVRAYPMEVTFQSENRKRGNH
jgi:hypothetical protein